MDIAFAQDSDGTTGTVTDSTASGGYPAPNTDRGDAANYLLWSKTDKDGVRTFDNPQFGSVLAVTSWAVDTPVSGLYEAILLRISPYDGATAYVEEQSSGGIITQYASVVYYATTNKVYLCNDPITGELPTNTSYWEEVTDLSTIIGNTNIEEEIINVNSDRLINKAIAELFADGGCECSHEDMVRNNQFMGQKRAAEINYASGLIYEYEKIIEQLNSSVEQC